MVQLTNSTPGSLGSLNRDTDSPKLWIGVISGSLLLHLLLGLGLLWSTMLQGQLKSSEKRTEKIPIEFITLPADTASLNQEEVLESSPVAPAEEQSVSPELSSIKVQPQPTVSSITITTPKPEKSVVTSPSPKISVPQPQSSPIPQKQEKTPSPSNPPQLKNEQSTETKSIPQETTPSSSPLAETTEKRSSPKTPSPTPTSEKVEANASPTTPSPSPTPTSEKVEANSSPTTSPSTANSEETETPDSQAIAQQNFPIPTNPENYPSVPPKVTESSDVNPFDSPLVRESASVQTETPPSKEIPDSTPSSSSFQGLIASLGTPRLTHPDRDIPDRLAKATQTSQEFSISYLSPLEEEFDGNSLIEVVIIVEKDGKSTIAPDSITVLGGNLKQDKAEKLAKEIIEQWQFEPTYMGGQAVVQTYFVQLKTSPF